MGKKIEELAPTLIDGGIEKGEIKQALRPKKAKAPVEYVPPKPKPLRYRNAMNLLAKKPELSDEEIAQRVTTVTPELVAKLRVEVEAVKAELASLPPVNEDDPPEEEPIVPPVTPVIKPPRIG